jgi:quinol monooxygenase YgiN
VSAIAKTRIPQTGTAGASVHDVLSGRVSRYKDKAALAAHGKTEYFQAFSKRLAADKLVAAPLQMKMVKPIAGYSSRL